MATDYGTDFSTYPDLDWGRRVSGPDAVIQAVARALEDKQIGVDVREWLNADFAPADLYNLQEMILSRCLADERVQDARVDVSSPVRFELRIAIFVALADGSTPFRRVLNVTQLGVQILTES